MVGANKSAIVTTTIPTTTAATTTTTTKCSLFPGLVLFSHLTTEQKRKSFVAEKAGKRERRRSLPFPKQTNKQPISKIQFIFD